LIGFAASLILPLLGGAKTSSVNRKKELLNESKNEIFYILNMTAIAPAPVTTSPLTGCKCEFIVLRFNLTVSFFSKHESIAWCN
jgi:hypothetical protein